MKAKLLSFAAIACLLSLNSCKKDAIEKPNAMITIDVECAACALVFNTEYNPETLLQVRSKGSYSFELDKIDTLNIHVLTSPVIGLYQDVKIGVRASKKVVDTKSFSGRSINEKYDVNLAKFK